MKKLTYEEVKNGDNVLYYYIRGSHAYGLEKPDGTSDIDTAMVYMEPVEQLLGLGLDFQDQVADERNDNVAYSLRKFMNMLLSSNPTVLESLFIPENCILYEHPIFTELKKHRDKFITKACFKPFLGYSCEQIKKCRGLNKRFLQEKIERKGPLDFAFTFYKQGSTKIENWLEHRGLKQKYCGLVNIPNMGEIIGVYYDWGRHFQEEGVTLDAMMKAYSTTKDDDTVELVQKLKTTPDLTTEQETEIKESLRIVQMGNMVRFIIEYADIDVENLENWFYSQKPIGYKGMVGEDNLSNELRLSSVSKNEKPICWMNYNKDGYSSHCVDYKNQKRWERERNPERYNENVGKLYDVKNVSHAVRLLHMGLEIARGEGFNVDRRNIDREFILNIRMGDVPYEKVIAYIESKKEEMDEAMKQSTLPDAIDVDFVNNLLLDIRKKQLGLTHL